MTARRLILLLSLLVFLPLHAETKIADLAWMAGHWTATIDGVEMEEHWSDSSGGLLLGFHRDVAQKRTSFEFLRIAETKDGIAYLAQPSGQPPTPFKLVESAEKRVVFANPEHDFPQRILYWMQDAKLCARVEGDGGEGEEWCWSRVKQ
ncbi:MAG: DUF6265 family protein [Thermoanaerobaculia bacterium]